MKPFLLLLCPLLLSLGGGHPAAPVTASDLPTFQAVVLSLTQDTARVEAQSGAAVRPGEQFTFPVRGLPAAGVREGDVVQLTYTGIIRETWPEQIEVTDWCVLVSGTPVAPLTGQTPDDLFHAVTEHVS